MPDHLHPQPRPPIPIGVAARATSRGQGLVQAWAGSQQIAAGATQQIAVLDLLPYEHEYHLIMRIDGGPVRLTVASEYQGGILIIRHTAILGPGGGWSLPPGAGCTLTGLSLSANPVTVRWALLDKGVEGLHAPYDFVVTGLTEGGAGAPGTWIDASDIGPGITLGWAPPDRHQLSICPNGALDFRLVDETALVIWSLFQTAQPVNIKHAGRARLQVRHPGASAVIRSAIMTWNRA